MLLELCVPPAQEDIAFLNRRLSGQGVCEMPGVMLATSSPWALLNLVFQMLDQIRPNPAILIQAKCLPFSCVSEISHA